MSLSNSRASSPINCTIADVSSTDQAPELDTKVIRHPQYYFEDGNTIFQVEGTLYNVHRYFFVRDSAHFRAILYTGENAGPCVLSDVRCADFDELLAVLYPIDFRQPMKKTTDQWSSILHLAEKWGFENITLLAIDNLIVHATPIDKIVLSRRHGITNWLPAAYEAVCTRADPLTLEEGMKLGMEDAMRISAARQLYGTGRASHDAKYLSGDLGQIFELVRPLDGNAEVEDGTEIAVKDMEQQVTDAQNKQLAHSRCVRNGGMNHNWLYGYHAQCANRCDQYGESDEERMAREAKEDRERQLVNLRKKLEAKAPNRAGRKERMRCFK